MKRHLELSVLGDRRGEDATGQREAEHEYSCF
jgi:hypothetical protein